MKRLILVAAVALLWRRQRQFERAVIDAHINNEVAVRRWMAESNKAIEEWMSESVKAIGRAFK